MIDKKADTSSVSDLLIVQRVLAGERKLLDVLYDRYAAKIYYKCLSVTKDKHVSKDLSHDILIKIFMSLDKFQGKADFSFWVYSITYNHCMTHIKKSSKLRYEDLDQIKIEPIASDEEDLENKVLIDLKLDQLEVLMGKLEPQEKILLLMRYQDKRSIKEISETLKIGQAL